MKPGDVVRGVAKQLRVLNRAAVGERGSWFAFGLFFVVLSVTRGLFRFSKLPVITGPVKLFCFPFQMGVSKVLTIVQESYQLINKMNFIRGQNTPFFSRDFDFEI